MSIKLQALLLIAIQQTKGQIGKKVTKEVKDERNRLAAKVKELKHVEWN